MAFTAASFAFAAIGVPQLGVWRSTGLGYRFWVNASDMAGFLGLACLLVCGMMFVGWRQCFAQEKLAWCVGVSVAALLVALLTPALSIVD